MYDRATAQRIEFRKQLESIHKASEILTRIQNRDVRARLDRFLTRQEELQARADGVLRILIVKNELGIGDAEKKWFREVAKVEEKIGGGAEKEQEEEEEREGAEEAEKDSNTLAGRREIVARLAGELCPLVGEDGASPGEGRRGMKTVVGRGEDVPEEVRMGKLRILRELLEREDALVKATKKKLENLTLEAERV
jgi:nucleoporin NUP82